MLTSGDSDEVSTTAPLRDLNEIVGPRARASQREPINGRQPSKAQALEYSSPLADYDC